MIMLHSTVTTVMMLLCCANVSKLLIINMEYTYLSHQILILQLTLHVLMVMFDWWVELMNSKAELKCGYNGFWGSVCHSYWDTADANVVCKQLGHQPTGAIVNVYNTCIMYTV